MGKGKVDERGRILIPLGERRRIGLKSGTELELIEEEGIILLKPTIPQIRMVQSMKGNWGKEAFLDAGEATFS